MDYGTFIADVIPAGCKKARLPSERPIKFRLCDLPLQRGVLSGEGIAGIKVGIAGQECESAMIIPRGALPRKHFHATPSRSSELRRVWTLVHVNLPDARQRHFERATFHSVNDDLRAHRAARCGIQKEGRHS